MLMVKGDSLAVESLRLLVLIEDLRNIVKALIYCRPCICRYSCFFYIVFLGDLSGSRYDEVRLRAVDNQLLEISRAESRRCLMHSLYLFVTYKVRLEFYELVTCSFVFFWRYRGLSIDVTRRHLGKLAVFCFRLAAMGNFLWGISIICCLRL